MIQEQRQELAKEWRQRPALSLPRLLGMGLGTRMVIDTSVQIFGPFLELIARGMGISIITLGWLNGLRNMMGLATPLVGVLADRIGYRVVMRVSLWMGGGGLILFAVGQQLWLNALGIIVWGSASSRSSRSSRPTSARAYPTSGAPRRSGSWNTGGRWRASWGSLFRGC